MSNYPVNSGDRDRRASTALRGQSANRGRGSVNGGGGGGGGTGFDLNSYVTGELLGLYNDQGVYTPGTAATRVSREGDRARVRAGFDRAERDRASNYGFIDQNIRGRNPQIRANYERATADLRGNARQRAIESRAAIMQREQESANAASALGLNVNPGATARASEVAEGAIGRTNTNAEAWAGFNEGAAGRAVERNDAVGDAFVWQGQQQRQELANVMMELIAGLQDYSVGGSAGGWSGGLKTSDKLRLLGMLDGQGDENFDRDMKITDLRQRTLWE